MNRVGLERAAECLLPGHPSEDAGHLFPVVLRWLGLRSEGTEPRTMNYPAAHAWSCAMCDGVQTATEQTHRL